MIKKIKNDLKCALNDYTLYEYFFLKKISYFNELARFGQFIKYTLFRSPFGDLVPISVAEGPHFVPI